MRYPGNLIAIAAVVSLCSFSLSAAAQQNRLDYYRVANGFVPEARNSYGWAKGSGFATTNPWGQYTAVLMLTNPAGQRTWRIEHYLPRISRPGENGPHRQNRRGPPLLL